MEIVYNLFALIDKLVYMLVSQMFSLIDNLANYNFFSDNTISEFTSKVYTILAVLMLFMLVISAIQYLVNPDSLSDNKKGLSTILTRSLIAVVLIAVVPTIFKFALSVQSTLVEEIPKIVLGGENNESLGTTADKVSLNILLGFVNPKTDGGNRKSPTISKEEVKTFDDFQQYATDGCGSHGALDIGSVINGWWCNNNYIIIIPTIIGGFLVFILASMAIDIGIRTIKLGVVQLLAPIPIVSSITDEKKLQTWAKTSGQVYVDLFIRMFVVYFVIYFIRVVLYDLFFGNTIGDLKNTGFMDIIWVKVFIIIALLLFAKNAPKFITDLLGMQGADESIGNMFKRAGGLLGAGLGAIRTARSNYTTQKERYMAKGKRKGRQIAEGLRSAAAGFGSAGARGMFMAGQGKGFKDVKQNAAKNAIGARNRRIDRADNLYTSEYGYMDYRKDVKREKLGIPSDSAFIKTRYDMMEQIAKVAADARGHGSGKMNETPSRYQVSFTKVDKNGNIDFKDDDYRAINAKLGYTSLSMQKVRDLYALAKNGQKVEDVNGNTVSLSAAELESLGSIVQTIEKRTSYLKEAELMGTQDPTAYPNVDKIFMAINNNSTMFNANEIMAPIIEKMNKYNIKDNDGNEIRNVSQLKEVVKSLQDFIDIKDKRRFPTEQDYFAEVDKRADLLTAIKDAFEEVARQQYAPAQISDARAKKAQQAINNNEKKGS